MTFVHLEVRDGHATVRLERGKVNALNEQVVDELTGCFRELEANPVVRGILPSPEPESFSPSASTSPSSSASRRRSSRGTSGSSPPSTASSSPIHARWWPR